MNRGRAKRVRGRGGDRAFTVKGYRSVTVIALRNPETPPSDTYALLPRLGRLGTRYITRSVVYLETLSCSLFLAEVTGRGYQREGFSGFLRAITVTERAIARSVDCECPISAATSDSLRSSSVRTIALTAQTG